MSVEWGKIDHRIKCTQLIAKKLLHSHNHIQCWTTPCPENKQTPRHCTTEMSNLNESK